MSDLPRKALALMQRCRREADTRVAVMGVCRRLGVADVPALAAEHPDVLADLIEMYEEMDADEQAMVDWFDGWNPLEQPSI